jgi:hypothetical protein
VSVMTGRGGVPRTIRVTLDATGRKINFPFFTLFLIARCVEANKVRFYFTELDWTNDVNYVELPNSTMEEWAGPAELGEVWARCATAGQEAELELIAFQRRG